MLWLTLLLAFLIALLVLAYVAWPLLRPTAVMVVDDDSPLKELIQRKDTLLLSIKEVEFDHHMGKLSVEDFQRLDQRLRQQAMTLLRQIEQTAPDTSGLEAELEAAIQRQRRVAERVAVNGQKGEAAHCPHCQAAVRPIDKFCPQCGRALAPVVSGETST